MTNDTEARWPVHQIQKIFGYSIGGVPLAIFCVMTSLILLFWQMDKLDRLGIVGAFAFLWSLGLVFFAIGEKLPVWKEFCGGGLIMAFLGSATLVHFGIIDQNDAIFLKSQVLDNRLLYLLLVALVGASVMSVPRHVLLRSISVFIPIILSGIAGAMMLALLGSLLFGMDAASVITHYVLPIMGGGNGAGAIPMAEIYAETTGNSGSDYYAFAISILTLANMVAILAAAILNKLGEWKPSLTGNGQLMKDEQELDWNGEVETEMQLNTHAALMLTFTVLLACFLLYALIPDVHVFAWAVMLFVVLNICDAVGQGMKSALAAISEWGMKFFMVMVLVAVGLTTDLSTLIDVFSIANMMIAVLTVCGAVLGTGIAARLFNCHPIEAAIAAGLCMANRGGSGDLEVLGASKRMVLFPYAQISSRIGGGIVLVLAGYLFQILI